MDYFFRCQKNVFNLEITNVYVKELFLLTTLLDILTPELFLYIQNVEEGIGKIQFA